MQPILKTTSYPDLYRFLAALAEESAVFSFGLDEAGQGKSVLVWSPEAHSSLLDSADKLALVEKYARKLGVNITLSAASDATLRELAARQGWKVLWEIPGLDPAIVPTGTNNSSSVAA